MQSEQDVFVDASWVHAAGDHALLGGTHYNYPRQLAVGVRYKFKYRGYERRLAHRTGMVTSGTIASGRNTPRRI